MWKTIAQVENFKNTLPRQANPDWGGDSFHLSITIR